jgi:hypothetical protein
VLKVEKEVGKIRQWRPMVAVVLPTSVVVAVADQTATPHPEELTERPESSSSPTLIPLPLSNQSAQV